MSVRRRLHNWWYRIRNRFSGGDVVPIWGNAFNGRLTYVYVIDTENDYSEWGQCTAASYTASHGGKIRYNLSWFTDWMDADEVVACMIHHETHELCHHACMGQGDEYREYNHYDEAHGCHSKAWNPILADVLNDLLDVDYELNPTHPDDMDKPWLVEDEEDAR